jgi:lysophospholipase L1-like esterase
VKRTWLLILLAVLSLSATSSAQTRRTWVAIGDSITYLNDHLDETGHRVTKGYMTLVTEALPHITYVNQGHNGWTAGRIAESIDALGLQRADVYSVFLGTNDWWFGRPVGTMGDYVGGTGAGTLYGAFRVIVDKLRQLNPKAPVILITPMQRVDFVYLANMRNNAWGSYRDKNGQWLEQFANAVRSIGEHEKFPVVDLYHHPGLPLERLVKFKRLKDPATGAYRNYPYPAFIDRRTPAIASSPTR